MHCAGYLFYDTSSCSRSCFLQVSLLGEFIDFLGSPGTPFFVLAETAFIRFFDFNSRRRPFPVPPFYDLVNVCLCRAFVIFKCP